MKPKSKRTQCSICKDISERVSDEAEIANYRKKLKEIAGQGRYYRGETYQLSVFRLLQCPQCDTYYEDGHHFYSDPESTMGLGRDEDDWYLLIKLSESKANERLKQLD